MATLLLFVIYIAFIGLGVPDSLFGTVWPAIYPEFDLPVSAASVVTLLISGCTVVSSLLSARIINRLGTAAVTAASTALTAAALLGFSLSGNLPWLCLFALPLGIGAGAIDSGLNNYVALHYRAAHMNFLHCFYGIGVSLSPYLMSLALAPGIFCPDGHRPDRPPVPAPVEKDAARGFRFRGNGAGENASHDGNDENSGCADRVVDFHRFLCD